MAAKVDIYYPIDKHAIIAKGKAVYAKLAKELEPEHNGEEITIEVDSGDYFWGEDSIFQARKKYPGKVFYTTRAGRGCYLQFRFGNI